MYVLQLVPMGVTGWGGWVDIRSAVNISVQTDCEDVDSPVGIPSFEISNDVAVIESELRLGVLPANSLAKSVGTATAANFGTPWTTGFNGVGPRVGVGAPWSTQTFLPAFVRVKWTRTSGGAGDTLSVRWHLAERLGRP